ncbi:MAG: class I SAM-dependent methyltransferase [Bacteroidota bacterium]
MGNELLRQGAASGVTDAFDAVAASFDERFENAITRRIRNKIHGIVESLLSPPSTILDINCGTGIDAMAFAQKGYSVTGIDISPGMIQQAKAKAHASANFKTAFSIGSFEHLSERVQGSFDIAFSNFGGLNCTDDLSGVAREVSSVLRPGGYFVAVVMPPFSLWEFFSYAVRGQRKNALRRMRRGTLATGFDGKSFTVFYHSPRTFMDACSPWFELRDLIGLSILSPTPQSTGFARTFPRLIRLLEWVDSKIERLPLFRSSGDHFIVICRKK